VRRRRGVGVLARGSADRRREDKVRPFHATPFARRASFLKDFPPRFQVARVGSKDDVSVFRLIGRAFKAGGVAGLWRGSTPVLARAVRARGVRSRRVVSSHRFSLLLSLPARPASSLGLFSARLPRRGPAVRLTVPRTLRVLFRVHPFTVTSFRRRR
jgi:hypothetical protein